MTSKMATAPPIPKIDNDVDLMLEIYTHASLRYPNAPLNDDYGDTARLADLGAKILEAVVSYHLFAFKPNKTATEIQEERKSILSPSNIGLWLDTYNLKSKLRANPSEIESILQSPEEMANFFHIYVGAIFIRKGLAPIQTWISALIDPGVDATLPGSQGPGGGAGFGQQQQAPPMGAYGMYSMHGGVGAMPQHGQHQQQQHGGYNPYGSPGGAAGGHNANAYSPYGSPPPPPGDAPPPPPGAPPPQPPPPPMGGPPPFAYGAAKQLSLVSLALVNQTASQQGVSVTYPAEQTGPPHLPTWTVKCCMNGIERGRGVGKSMKVAKEEAARQAWAAMGWGPS